ncbi:MAG: hypothetical protein JSR66_18145 [Proteobacteria bacterium]|nr:hypothetical protein [Pseudomonadota bacterium]
MAWLPLLVYVHILLMVFWIGTDVGVYLAGLRFMNPALPLEHRTAVINLGMVIDRIPRVCFVAMLPVGLQLQAANGEPALTATVMTVAWGLSAVWIVAVIAGMRLAGTSQARPWHRIERFFQLACLIGLTVAGIGGLSAHWAIPAWLSGKLIAYGAICGFVILLERAFAPVIGTFAAITSDGSTAEREASLRDGMRWTYVWVLAIYLAVLVSGYLGTVKP